VTQESQVDHLMEMAVKVLGKIDIVIANAGQSTTYKLVDLPEEEWDRVVDVDLKGVFLTDRSAARYMIQQGNGGRVINIASAAGLRGTVGVAPYCAAKAGVVNLTRVMAKEWARYKITVNCICPGYVPTSINETKLADPKISDNIIKFSALRRLGKIEEVSAAALYLASDFSGYMTGTHMLIDGGGGA
jgi:NAD(P)-dependent dehydrogenase (short-subunit alcohol dehydrogenase family)